MSLTVPDEEDALCARADPALGALSSLRNARGVTALAVNQFFLRRFIAATMLALRARTAGAAHPICRVNRHAALRGELSARITWL